jgi:hypothetical protein
MGKPTEDISPHPADQRRPIRPSHDVGGTHHGHVRDNELDATQVKSHRSGGELYADPLSHPRSALSIHHKASPEDSGSRAAVAEGADHGFSFNWMHLFGIPHVLGGFFLMFVTLQVLITGLCGVTVDGRVWRVRDEVRKDGHVETVAYYTFQYSGVEYRHSMIIKDASERRELTVGASMKVLISPFVPGYIAGRSGEKGTVLVMGVFFAAFTGLWCCFVYAWFRRNGRVPEQILEKTSATFR